MTKLLGIFGSFTAATTLACLSITTGSVGAEKIFDIGNKRLEGIHTLTPEDVAELGITGGSGKYVLATEFFYGGVHLVDVEEQTFEYLVPTSDTFAQRGGLGVTYTNGHILVTGAGPLLDLPFEIYVYSPEGELVTTCVPPSDPVEGFFNDFEIVGDVAYVTDSTEPRLWNFNIPEAIAGNCTLNYQELDDVFDPSVQNTTIESNGIVSVGDGLLIALFNSGGIYYFNPSTGFTEEVVPRGTMGRPDGLELVTENDGTLTLYVTVGETNNLFVYKVDSSVLPRLTFVDTIESPGYDTPATSAVVDDQIYTANLQGDRLPLLASGEDDLDTFEERFTIVGVSRLVGDMGSDEGDMGSDEGDTGSDEGDMGSDEDDMGSDEGDMGSGAAATMTMVSLSAIVAGSILLVLM